MDADTLEAENSAKCAADGEQLGAIRIGTVVGVLNFSPIANEVGAGGHIRWSSRPSVAQPWDFLFLFRGCSSGCCANRCVGRPYSALLTPSAASRLRGHEALSNSPDPLEDVVLFLARDVVLDPGILA